MSLPRGPKPSLEALREEIGRVGEGVEEGEARREGGPPRNCEVSSKTWEALEEVTSGKGKKKGKK